MFANSQKSRDLSQIAKIAVKGVVSSFQLAGFLEHNSPEDSTVIGLSHVEGKLVQLRVRGFANFRITGRFWRVIHVESTHGLNEEYLEVLSRHNTSSRVEVLDAPVFELTDEKGGAVGLPFAELPVADFLSAVARQK